MHETGAESTKLSLEDLQYGSLSSRFEINPNGSCGIWRFLSMGMTDSAVIFMPTDIPQKEPNKVFTVKCDKLSQKKFICN